MRKWMIGWMICLFAWMGGGDLWAQEGTYVVTRKAEKIPVYNHDNEVIGYLKRGDKVFVTQFHRALPQADGSSAEPVTFVEYKGEEGILYLESPEWMECLETTAVDLDQSEENQTLPEQSASLILGLVMGNLLLLIWVAKPINGIVWKVRERMKRKGFAFLVGGITLLWCLLELYVVYTLDDPLWFSRWREVGVLKMLGGLFGMLLWIAMQIILLNSVVAGLAGMQRANYHYFDYGMMLMVAFVGTWLVLILDTWEVDWKFEAQLGVAVAAVIYLGFRLRNVARQRSILSALLILLIVVTGVPLLCYVSLEAFSRVAEIAMWLLIAYAVIEGLYYSRFVSFPPENDEIVQFFDEEQGISRQLYKDGNGYVDYSDGSRWVKQDAWGGYRRVY